ncbi:MAG: energy transducer TonB [Methylotenera sp.]|uniref:energy transducer TonB n=1 Tax=Methylotenera sp. TaxID=2051956 RepID=UPI0024891A90|nr:energy transducer TonB [Methylotenera sp.]MDI1309834.1 energy transducer TonB [Methylotenera sp.]
MNIVINHSNHSQSGAINPNSNTLIWAIFSSILLHVLLAFIIPNIEFDAVKKPVVLTVELTKKSEPAPVAIPEPAKAEPEPIKPKIEPKPEPKPITKPLPTPSVVKNEPSPITPPPPSTAPPQTEIIAATPKVDSAPSPMPPVPVVIPEPPKTPAPSQDEVNDANARYGSTLWGAISKYKQYPRIAQIRGWEGEAIVELLLDGNGKLKSKKIIQSSGFESLDKQALEMVEKAAPFPAPPEALRGSNFSIKVPIPFKLQEQ